ncbi:hypothetical protein [Streptomyces hundungensis]
MITGSSTAVPKAVEDAFGHLNAMEARAAPAEPDIEMCEVCKRQNALSP